MRGLEPFDQAMSKVKTLVDTLRGPMTSTMQPHRSFHQMSHLFPISYNHPPPTPDQNHFPKHTQHQYSAAMMLGAVGDALAYRRGEWEFQKRGREIHRQVEARGGLANLDVGAQDVHGALEFPVSDDTVMHLATAEALVEAGELREERDLKRLFMLLARKYVSCMDDMEGRSPGITCIKAASLLNSGAEDGFVIPFDRAGGGCGAAMRSMCIGLRFPFEEQEDKLIAVAVESGRMTHNHPTGYLGSLASAMLTAYAVRNIDPVRWGRMFLASLPKALKYIESTGRDYQEAKDNWDYFENAWRNYLQLRKIDEEQAAPTFPENYGVEERDAFYKSISWSGWGGSSGHDAPIIAYDAFLGCDGSWDELANRGFFHGGDSDSTGVICGTWFGLIHGYTSVPNKNFVQIEKRDKLLELANQLFRLSTTS